MNRAIASSAGGFNLRGGLPRIARSRTIAGMTFLYRAALAALIVAVPAVAVPAATKPAAKPAASKPKPVAKPRVPAVPKPAPPPPNVAQKNGFGVMQVSSDDTTRFIAAWKVGNGPKATVTRTVANKPLFVLLIFQGCKPDTEGKCDIAADFVITRPDGTTNEDNKGIVVWNKAAPVDPKKPTIGDGALGYGVDDEGPFGDYKVVATVTDKVAGVSVTTEQTLTIAPGMPQPGAK